MGIKRFLIVFIIAAVTCASAEIKTHFIKDDNTGNVSVLGIRRIDGLVRIKEKLKGKFFFENHTVLVEGEEAVITKVKDEVDTLLTITTMGDGNRIWNIVAVSPRIKTSKGICIGKKLRDVVTAYGEPKEVLWGEGATFATYEGLNITFSLEYVGPELSASEVLWWENTGKYMDDIVVTSIGITGPH